MLGTRIDLLVRDPCWRGITQVLVLYERAEDDYDQLVQIAESFPSLSETNEMTVVFARLCLVSVPGASRCSAIGVVSLHVHE